MAGKQGYGRSPELSLKSIYIFSSTFGGSSHLERPERRFFRNLHFWVGAPTRCTGRPGISSRPQQWFFAIGRNDPNDEKLQIFDQIWTIRVTIWGLLLGVGASARSLGLLLAPWGFCCIRELLLYS